MRLYPGGSKEGAITPDKGIRKGFREVGGFERTPRISRFRNTEMGPQCSMLREGRASHKHGVGTRRGLGRNKYSGLSGTEGKDGGVTWDPAAEGRGAVIGEAGFDMKELGFR